LKNARWQERGLESLKEATRLAPSRTEYLRATARALLAQGRKREAEPYARRAAELEPGPESSALLKEVTGRPTLESAMAAPVESDRRGGLISRLLGKKR
jgi:hypothetical protein